VFVVELIIEGGVMVLLPGDPAPRSSTLGRLSTHAKAEAFLAQNLTTEALAACIGCNGLHRERFERTS